MVEIGKNGVVNGSPIENDTQVCFLKNDIVLGQNLISNTDFGGVPKKYTLSSGTEGGFRFTPVSQVQSGVTYTVSLLIRGDANINLYRLNTGGNEASSFINRTELSQNEYRFFEISFITPSSKTTNEIYICTRYGTSNSQVGDWFEIKPNSLKLEIGSKATPYSSSDLQFNLNFINPIQCNEIKEI